MRERHDSAIDIAVIAAGGYGTRFLPFSSEVPKELLPLGSVPVIQHLVEECLDAGIGTICIVTRPGKESIESYFRRSSRWEAYASRLRFISVDDSLPKGNAQTVLAVEELTRCAAHFLLLFGDDLVLGGESSVRALIASQRRLGCDAAVAVTRAPPSTSGFGRIHCRPDGTIREIKRGRADDPGEPGAMIQIGQMLLPGDVARHFASRLRTANELCINEALNRMSHDLKVVPVEVAGTWVTVGDPENYMKACIAYQFLNGLAPESLLAFIRRLQTR